MGSSRRWGGAAGSAASGGSQQCSCPGFLLSSERAGLAGPGTLGSCWPVPLALGDLPLVLFYVAHCPGATPAWAVSAMEAVPQAHPSLLSPGRGLAAGSPGSSAQAPGTLEQSSQGPKSPGRGHVLPGGSLASLSTESSPVPQTQGVPDYGCLASTLGVGGQRKGAPPSSRTMLGKNSGHKRPSALGCREPLVPGPRPASRLKAQAMPSWGLTMSLEPGCRVQACSESKGTVGVIHSANTFWAHDLHQALCWAPRP